MGPSHARVVLDLAAGLIGSTATANQKQLLFVLDISGSMYNHYAQVFIIIIIYYNLCFIFVYLYLCICFVGEKGCCIYDWNKSCIASSLYCFRSCCSKSLSSRSPDNKVYKPYLI